MDVKGPRMKGRRRSHRGVGTRRSAQWAPTTPDSNRGSGEQLRAAQCGAEVLEGVVQVRVALVADEQVAVSVQPGERAFHDPDARVLTRCRTGATLRSCRPVAAVTLSPRQRRFRPRWTSSD